MADGVALPKGFTLDPVASPSVPKGFTLDPVEKKGSYLSGAQGLVPDVAEEIGKGIYSGIVSVPQGIAELGAIGVDGVLGTNTGRVVTDAFEAIKPELKGAAGEVTEDLVAFGVGFIPIAGWLGRAGQAAKLAKAGKPMSTAGRSKFTKSAIEFGTTKTGQKALGTWSGLAGSTAVGALGYSTAVASDGRATLSDNFSALPDFLKTEQDEGLTGRQEAGRRLRNKLRVGVEDGILSGVFDVGLKGLAVGSRAIGRTETAGAAAKALRAAPSKVGGAFVKTLDTLDKATFDVGAAPKVKSGMSAATDKFKEYFTASRGADTKLYETVQDARARADLYERQGIKAAEDWKKAADSFLKSAKLQDKTPVDAEKLGSDLNSYLLGANTALDKYGNKALIKAADKMIEVRSELDDRIVTQLEEAIGFKAPLSPEDARLRGQLEALGVTDLPGKRTTSISERMINQRSGRPELQDPVLPGQIKAAKALKEITDAQKSQRGYLRRLFKIYTNPVEFYRNLDLTSKEFDDAVFEVARNNVTGKGRAPNENDLLIAKATVYNTLGLNTLGGVPPEMALENALKSATEAGKGKGFGLLAKERPVLSSVDDIFIERKEILDASPSLRKVMEEITDPVDVYTRTITDMAQANAAADMYTAMRPQGLVSSLFEGVESLVKGGRPALIEVPDATVMSPEEYVAAMAPYNKIAKEQNDIRGQGRFTKNASGELVEDPNYLKGQDVVNERMTALSKAGYVQLKDSKDIEHVFGGSYGDLTGMYASPESYGALTAPLRLGTGALGEAAGILSELRSLSQKMTIVPNPGAQVRNIVGNIGMLAANANLGRETDFTDMLKIFTSSLDNLDEAGLNRLARKVALTGVADTSLVTRALREFRDAGRDLTTTGKFANKIDFYEGKMIPFMRTFEKIYGESDTFFKGLSLLGEEKKIRNALSSSGLRDDPRVFQIMKENGLVRRDPGATKLTEGLDFIEVIAGDVVKDTMPIYPRVGKLVRSIDMVPIFGNFTSFASENIRNTVNIMNRGLKEMAFEVSPSMRKEIGDVAADELTRQFRAMGAQRLMSYYAVASIIPKSMVRASMVATGTTDEQMDAVRQQLPKYMDGHDIVILGNDGKGKVDYIDLSYVSPYAFVIDPVRAALQTYHQKGKLDKSEVEQIASGAWRGLEMFAEPFGQESMIYERLRDVLPKSEILGLGIGRGGKTSTGADVYAETDPLGEQFGEGLGHIMNGLIPEYARLVATVENPFKLEVEPGRVYRSVTGLPGKRGEEYNPFKEGARLITGFTPMTVDLKNDFAFKGLEYGPRRTDAKQSATKVLKRADASMEDMTKAWSKYLDNLYREQSQLYVDIQAARELGLSDSEIRKNLINKANLSRKEVGAIMDGRFFPTAATRELAKDLNAMRSAEGRTSVESSISFEEFNRMSSERMNEPLAKSDPSEERPVAPLPSSLPPGFNLDPVQAPTPAPAPSSLPPGFTLDPLSSLPAPQLPQPTQTASAKINPIVLGNDPATQALANALGRT